MTAETGASRAERKDRTRRALLDAALKAAATRSFDSLSLREVARSAGIVPTAFYRHFDSMDDVGIALVEESMRSLRQMAREVRRTPSSDPTTATVELLARHVRANEAHFRFVMRERYGGIAALRRAIAVELKLFTSELMIDFARTPAFAGSTTEDLEIAADLMVAAMQSTVMGLLEADRRHPEDEAEVLRRAVQQLRLIALGMQQWKPRT